MKRYLNQFYPFLQFLLLSTLKKVATFNINFKINWLTNRFINPVESLSFCPLEKKKTSSELQSKSTHFITYESDLEWYLRRIRILMIKLWRTHFYHLRNHWMIKNCKPSRITAKALLLPLSIYHLPLLLSLPRNQEVNQAKRWNRIPLGWIHHS